jgi:transcriptional regulator with XRE-family HTH domain
MAKAKKAKRARAADAVDGYVGARIRAGRKLAGLSQSDLGARLGVTFQQVQKYEKGTNRVGASRLNTLAEIFGVGADWFYEGMTKGAKGTRQNDQMAAFMRDPFAARIVTAFPGLDSDVKRRLVNLMESTTN